jgi:nucleoside-diphosphate-sugar epimerase
MKVLIAGAAGYLGGHIVEAAIAAGHSVTVCVRETNPARFPDGVNCVRGDLREVDFVQRELKDVDGVVFSAGRNWRPGLSADECPRENVPIVQVFFEALANANPTARVVFTSSMSAIGGSLEPVIFTEDFGGNAVCKQYLSAYDAAKSKCEGVARAAAAAGFRIVILNPGFMLGPGASASANVTTSMLVQWFCLRRLPAFANGGGHSF